MNKKEIASAIGLTGLVASCVLGPAAGGIIVGVPLAAATLGWLTKMTAEGMAYLAGKTAEAYQHGKQSYVPVRLVVHQVPDTRMEDYKEAHRRFEDNCRLIRESKLAEDAKKALLAAEMVQLEERVKQLML